MSDRVRVMRIIIYDGPREWVENTVARSIKGTKIVDPTGSFSKLIHGFTVNEFPEIINQIESIDENI